MSSTVIDQPGRWRVRRATLFGLSVTSAVVGAVLVTGAAGLLVALHL